MKQHSIDSGSPGPHVLISAGVHGDEFEPMMAAYRLVGALHEKVTKGKVTIVPVVNNSAFGSGKRLGQDNIDLARVCPGNLLGSVTEKAAFAISSLINTADYYIDLHNGGKLFNILPFAGYMLHDNKEILNKQREMAKSFSLPFIWGTSAESNGRTLSVARDANVPAIYIEHGGGTAFNTVAMQDLIAGCESLMVSLGMCAGKQQLATSSPCIIEDDEKSSGYLQVKMPSPVDGIFIPMVKTGDSVKAGDCWGTVCNPITAVERKVNADKSGIVLFLRSYPKVLAGESLGGILAIHQ